MNVLCFNGRAHSLVEVDSFVERRLMKRESVVAVGRVDASLNFAFILLENILHEDLFFDSLFFGHLLGSFGVLRVNIHS